MNWIFVTGTGTEVGKTYYAAALARTCQQSGQRVGVYKPVASGCQRDGEGRLVAEDAVQLWQAAGQPLTLETVCPQKFAAPLAPPEAAAADGCYIDEELLLKGLDAFQPQFGQSQAFDTLIIEGAGGLFSPISDTWLNIDFILKAKSLHPIEVILVAANRLGVQHEIIATTRAAQASGLTIDRVILNTIHPDDSTDTNATELAKWIDTPIQT